MEVGELGRCGPNGTWRGPEEPDGTPRNTNRRPFRPQIRLISAVFALLGLSFSHFLLPSLLPDVSVVSRSLALVGRRNIGAM